MQKAEPGTGVDAVDRLTSMEVFARVVVARSFSAAARDLGISQATASKHVQTLEGWIGARLLNRTTRRVSLTETVVWIIGRILYAVTYVSDPAKRSAGFGISALAMLALLLGALFFVAKALIAPGV